MPALESGNLSYSIWTDGKAGLGLSWFSDGQFPWASGVERVRNIAGPWLGRSKCA